MNKRRFLLFTLAVFTLLALVPRELLSQNVDSLDLLDASDVNVLIEEEKKSKSGQLNLSNFEEVDDLESLKSDIGEIIFDDKKKSSKKKKTKSASQTLNKSTGDETEVLVDKGGKVVNDEATIQSKVKNQEKTIESSIKVFDVGAEERELLELSRFVETKIPDKDWDEIATSAQIDKYIVQEGDWLWKISQKLFGSGFYYSKVWSLNPQISNPHEIEPGMTLVFTTGDSSDMPDVQVSDFGAEGEGDDFKGSEKSGDYVDFRRFGDSVKPPWIMERNDLIKEGVYFQYASEETLDDLKKIAEQNLVSEYQKYEPPVPDIVVQEPGENYDSTGFDKSSRIVFDVKEGFFLNTFVTSNIVQDLGEVVGMGKENVFIQQFDKIYVKFDNSVKTKPGDLFSVYIPGGPVSHKVSDRSGYKYTIGAQIKAIRKINQKWECLVTELSGIVQRKDRVTVYTPKIGKIIKTFNKRNIEAAVIDSYQPSSGGLSFGDVVYLDRGRADGVEMGTVFELYSFLDKGTEKRLTPDPTYKIGELTVISLTDNFVTALVTQSSEPIPLGTIALTKTEEQAMLAASVKKRDVLQKVKDLEGQALDELDVSLNLDEISKELLDRADQVQLTEDELEELERQEREHSIIQDHERDLKELERLETEILEAESALNEGKVDEDKFLEQQNLNQVEKGIKGQDPNSFESLNDIEEEVGLKFMDEDLNSKENPYGLTEFDLEEIDELLNTEQL